MSTMDVPNDILNNTPADATQVDQNYTYIQQWVNAEVIRRDGGVGMQAQLHLFAEPLSPLDAASKSYVDALLPIAVIMPYGGQDAPAGGKWALCNGASLAVATYTELHNRIGYRYGGSGGTFMLPNMAGRFPIGMDTTQPEFSATGKKGGSFTVPVPQHNHPMPHGHPVAHTHEHPHTHPIDPPATNTSNPLQGHRHDLSMRQTNTPGTTGSAMQAGTAGTTTGQFTGNDDTVHQHQVNIPSFTSGAVSEATTGTSSIANTGQPSITTTSNTGVSGAELQPPFVVFTFIIRIL